MEEMLSPYVLQPNPFLYVSFALLLGQGLLYIVECVLGALTADYSRPNYHDHEHHLCHVFIMIISLFAFWYLTAVVLLLRNFEAFRQTWALNLLGIPTTVVMLSECCTFTYLLWTYEDHDEKSFVFALSFGSGVLLVSIAWWALTLAHVPLRQGKQFAWNWLAMYGFFLAIYIGTCYYNNFALPTILGGLVGVPYAFGLYESKQKLAAKKLT